jgi:hypothetical protein
MKRNQRELIKRTTPQERESRVIYRNKRALHLEKRVRPHFTEPIYTYGPADTLEPSGMEMNDASS